MLLAVSCSAVLFPKAENYFVSVWAPLVPSPFPGAKLVWVLRHGFFS